MLKDKIEKKTTKKNTSELESTNQTRDTSHARH